MVEDSGADPALTASAAEPVSRLSPAGFDPGYAALAERCEQATGPDRKLDLALAVAVNYGEAFEDPYEWRWNFGGDEIEAWEAEKRKPSGYLDPAQFVPRYTISLDAALTLVPEGLDPQICKGPMFALAANEVRPWGVSLIGNARQVEDECGPAMDYDSFNANASSAALAVCAAALRARDPTPD